MASRSLTVARRAAVAVCAPLARGFRAAAILSTRAEVVPTKKSQKQASLASILEKELQYEKEDNNTEANLKEIADSLEGWTLKNETGTSRFQVSRKVSACISRGLQLAHSWHVLFAGSRYSVTGFYFVLAPVANA